LSVAPASRRLFETPLTGGSVSLQALEKARRRRWALALGRVCPAMLPAGRLRALDAREQDSIGRACRNLREGDVL